MLEWCKNNGMLIFTVLSLIIGSYMAVDRYIVEMKMEMQMLKEQNRQQEQRLSTHIKQSNVTMVELSRTVNSNKSAITRQDENSKQFTKAIDNLSKATEKLSLKLEFIGRLDERLKNVESQGAK